MSEDDRGLSARQDDSSIIRARLAEASRRIRGLRAVSRGARFALLAHLILGPWLLLRGLVPLPLGLYLLALLVAATSGAVYGLLAPLPPSSVARLLDHRLALKERLGSALEVMHRQGDPMVDALLHDAAAVAEGARLAMAVPAGPPVEVRYLLPALTLAVALFLLPPLPLWMHGSTDLRGRLTAEEEQASLAPVAEASRSGSPDRDSPKEPHRWESRVANRGQAAPRQARADLTATFKDTAIASKRADFAAFLKGADERLKLLAPSAALPDLQEDYTQSPNQARIRRMQETLREARLGKLSPTELQGLMADLKSLQDQRDMPLPSDGKRMLEDFAGIEGGPSDKRLEALERALSRLRKKGGGQDKRGQTLRPAPEPGLGAGDEGEEETDEPDGSRQEELGRGSRPGRARSPQVRGRPTPRIGTSKLDSALSGQVREGEQESYDANLSGAPAKSSSRHPYKDLLTQYRRMAEEALSKERVPFNYREQVKEYFKSLEQ